MSKREGGDAADAQEEILAACCNALDKAHYILAAVAKYEILTPQMIAKAKEWVDGEYDPGTRQPRRCRHNWAKYALKSENGMYCTRCGIPRSVGCQ